MVRLFLARREHAVRLVPGEHGCGQVASGQNKGAARVLLERTGCGLVWCARPLPLSTAIMRNWV